MSQAMEVVINLRIPRVKTPVKDGSGYPIDNGSVRYLRRLTLPELPKPGTMLRLDTAAGQTLDCEVARSEWDDRENLFIVYGRYAKRSIPPEEYHALVEDPAWEMRPLL